MKRESILIFTAELAKKLLKLGYTIIDIKPNKENKERTVFVFKNSDELEANLRELTQ